MGDPYKATRSRRSNERAGELDTFLNRLAALGADPAQMSDVASNWDNFEGGYTRADRDMLVRSSDADLRAKLRQIDEEYEIGTRTEEETGLERMSAAVTDAEVEAVDLMSLPVPKLVDWVGGNRARAMAVSNLERGPDGGQRKTLLDAVDRVITGGA